MIEQGSGGHAGPVNRQSSRKHKEDASSDDEQQDSKKGRSKLERWTSHKERDFSIGTKSSSSLNVKEIDGHKKGGTSLANTLLDESSKTAETGQNSHPLVNEKDVADQVNKNVEVKPMEDRHLDTVAKLKKRSERFKLPMPSEKEAVAIKKMENETLPLVQTESRTDSVIKQERPARKRRWTGN